MELMELGVYSSRKLGTIVQCGAMNVRLTELGASWFNGTRNVCSKEIGKNGITNVRFNGPIMRSI